MAQVLQQRQLMLQAGDWSCLMMFARMFGNLGNGCASRVVCTTPFLAAGTADVAALQVQYTAGVLPHVAKLTAVHMHVCRLTMYMRCKRSSGKVGIFRQAYDVEAGMAMTGALAKAVQACGLPPGEKAHSIGAEQMTTVR